MMYPLPATDHTTRADGVRDWVGGVGLRYQDPRQWTAGGKTRRFDGSLPFAPRHSPFFSSEMF
jgi:hypothetical protein